MKEENCTLAILRMPKPGYTINILAQIGKRAWARLEPNRISSFQVYLDFLLTTLSRCHFAFKNKYGSVERHLSTLSDAFCAAYSEADCFTMRLCVDFLQDFQKQTSTDVVEEKPTQNEEALMDVIRQLFCIADFSEGKRIPHYSKSQIFIQKFNFDKTPTFSRVFHPNFFSREIKVVNS